MKLLIALVMLAWFGFACIVRLSWVNVGGVVLALALLVS